MAENPAIRVVVAPIGRGRYSACLGERPLVHLAKTPFFDAARVLLAEGIDPDHLEMLHRGRSLVAMRGRLAGLAGLVVSESERSGPIFATYTPFDRAPVEDSVFPLTPTVEDGGFGSGSGGH